VFNSEAEERTKVQGQKIQQVQAVRQAARLPYKIPDMPPVFQGNGVARGYPRRDEGKLVV